MSDKFVRFRDWLNLATFRDEVKIQNIGKHNFVVRYDDIIIASSSQDMHGDYYVLIYSKEHWDKKDYLHELSDTIEWMCFDQRINYMIRFTY